MVKRQHCRNTDSFQADLDPTWQWGGGNKKAGLPWKWEMDLPPNLQVYWKPSVLKTPLRFLEWERAKKTLWEGQWRTRPLRGRCETSSVAEMLFKQPCWVRNQPCAFRYTARGGWVPVRSQTLALHLWTGTCKDLNCWETYRREQQGKHEQS